MVIHVPWFESVESLQPAHRDFRLSVDSPCRIKVKSTVTRESGKILLICIETQSGNARGCVSNNKVGISNTAGTCAEPSGSLEGDARPAKAASSSHFSYIYLTHILYSIYNSSMTSTPAERDEQLLSIGKQCSHPACLLVDFLPFKCQHCEDAFCQEHFLVSAHNCTKYDESKHNRVAPNCPLCNTPVSIRPGQDSNVRMDEHLTNDCSVLTGKSGRARTMPVCARGGCKKVLFSPIRCNNCKSQFCPSHRFPADHSCSSTAATQSKPVTSKLLPNINATNINVKVSAAGAVAMSAVKKTKASVSTPKPVTQATKPVALPKPVSATTHTNMFSKTNRLLSSSPAPLLKTFHNATTDAPANDISTSITSTNAIPTIPNDIVSMPIPVIKFNSFVPRPIFANA